MTNEIDGLPETASSESTEPIIDFSSAVRMMKDGYSVARKGWAKDEFIAAYIPSDLKGRIAPCFYIERVFRETNINMRRIAPCMYMITAQNKLVSWLPSQADIFAIDWFEL